MRPSSFALLEETALASIERQADAILATVGLRLQDDPQSLAALSGHGARIEGDRVFIEGDRLRALIALAPERFVWRGAVAKKDVVVGGERPVSTAE